MKGFIAILALLNLMVVAGSYGAGYYTVTILFGAVVGPFIAMASWAIDK